jgi:hypothetical protein
MDSLVVCFADRSSLPPLSSPSSVSDKYDRRLMCFSPVISRLLSELTTQDEWGQKVAVVNRLLPIKNALSSAERVCQELLVRIARGPCVINILVCLYSSWISSHPFARVLDLVLAPSSSPPPCLHTHTLSLSHSHTCINCAHST